MPMLVTMATLQRSNARPSRRMPPRAVSNTAASTSGCMSTLRAARAAAVARVDAQVVDVHAVGIGHADAVAGGAQQMRGQAHGGGLAVGAGHRHDRDAAIFAVGVHVGDDGLAHIAALAEGRIQVHAQAGRGIDFHHAAVLFLQRIQHALGDDVHAADVQADHSGGRHGARGHLGMDLVGHVGGRAASAQVGVVAQEDQRARGGTESAS